MLLEIKSYYVARAHLMISLSVFTSSEVTTCFQGSEVYFLIEERFPPRELKVSPPKIVSWEGVKCKLPLKQIHFYENCFALPWN